MKKAILFLFIIGAVNANAQSLKDLLYSGKLKMDSNSVIRKGDDLSAKIDTSTKKPTEPEKPKTVSSPVEPSLKTQGIPTDSATALADISKNETPTSLKSNNQVWKEYMDSLVSILKTEVLSSKKIKKETYYVYVEYEIATDGQVNVTNVTANPENSFLQDQVKERLLHTVPQLSPVLDSANKPRKVKRKYNFILTKE
jgi:hypothetical protein